MNLDVLLHDANNALLSGRIVMEVTRAPSHGTRLLPDEYLLREATLEERHRGVRMIIKERSGDQI